MKVNCKFLHDCKKDNTIPECEGNCIMWTMETGFLICSQLIVTDTEVVPNEET